jgi:cytoskeletal protein RodZ
VFEIGDSLREARLRRKLELSQVERDTHIRGKYLRALEDDRFDTLPGIVYAKGFLRSYADYLGLDGSRFVDEYNARFAPEEDEPPAGVPVRLRRRRSAHGRRLLVAPLAAAAIGLVAWQLSSSGSERDATFEPSHVTTRMKPPQTRRARPPVPGTSHVARFARVVIVASRGPCWLAVRKGSANGAQVFERTLQQGERAHFVARGLWIRLGAPWNADAILNDKLVRLPAAVADIVVRASGVRIVS